MTQRIWLGALAAVSAAALNGSGGLLSKYLIASGLTTSSIAFYKTVCALVLVTFALLLKWNLAKLVAYFRQNYKGLFIAAFMGVFVLYFFETAAFSYERVSIVAFILLGSSTLTTFALLSILERKMISLGNLVSIMLALSGLGMMFLESLGTVDIKGSVFAALAGVGYGSFLVIVKKFSLGSSLEAIWGLMFFASLFLFFPVAQEGLSPLSTFGQVGFIALSALIPTLLGFWCTTKSLELIDSSRVQLLELTEPIFAMIFAATLIGERVSSKEAIGASLVIVSIFCFEKLDDFLYGLSARQA